MKIQKRWVVVLTIVTLTVVLALTGCKKDQAKTDDTDVDEQTVVQKNCPIMGGAIDKDVFTEYKGKKVYFCCAGCPEKFAANPEKYISKLPQFQE